MYNPKKKTLVFPHFILGNAIGGKEHTWNNVNGGVKRLADFNIIRNKFLGGNVEIMGFIKEYGFFACPHFEKTQLILGFYIHDPSIVTDLGKKLIQEKYPDANILWDKVAPTVHKQVSQEEIDRRKKLQAEAIANGAKAEYITHATADELDGLLQAISSGKGKRAVIEEPAAEVDDRPVVVQHRTRKA